MRTLFSRFREWKQVSLLRRTVVTVATFVLLSCASIAFMSYAALAATQAIFKAPPASSAASSSGAASDDPVELASASGTKVNGRGDAATKTASTPQKGAVRSKAKPAPAEDDD